MKIEILKEPEHRVVEDDDYGEFSIIIGKIQQKPWSVPRSRRDIVKEVSADYNQNNPLTVFNQLF